MFMERSKAFDSESLPAFSGLEEFSEFEDCGKLVGSVCACADATAAIADEFPEVRIELSLFLSLLIPCSISMFVRNG